MRKRTKIKICGITNEEDAYKLSQMAVDALGFIIIDIDRPFKITLKKARKIIANLPPFTTSVVCVSLKHNSLKEVVAILKETTPNAVQIFGIGGAANEIKKIKKEFPWLKIIKTINVSGKEALDEVKQYLKIVDMIHIDNKGVRKILPQKEYLKIAKEIVKISPKPVMLAGVLNSENIGEAVKIVRPYAVDLISGVETIPGRKDFNKVKKFLQAVKKADKALLPNYSA